MVADGLNRGVAAIGIELAHDAMNVVFDGEFRQAHALSNFFVGETACQEGHELLLACRQSQLYAKPLIENHGAFAGGAGHELEKVMTEQRGQTASPFETLRTAAITSSALASANR